jgi:uncharacterized repeat protein (TIGR01451 family)
MADLSIMVSGPSTVTAGTTATYTLTVMNAGPNAAQMVTLNDTLPTGGTLVALTPSNTNPDSFTVSGSNATAATVVSGNTNTFVLTVAAPSTLADGATFSNTAVVSSATTDPTPGNNTATQPGTISAPADLSVTATGPATVTAGTNATYTITVANTGTFAAQTVSLTDTIPSGATLVSLTPNTGNPDTFTVTGANATAPTVGPGNSDSLTLIVAVPGTLATGANFSNMATVATTTTNTSSNTTSTFTATVGGPLTVGTSGPSTVTAGTNATYTITLANTGTVAAQTVALTDTLPTGGTLVSLTPNTTNPDHFSVTGAVANATSVGAGNTDSFVLIVTAPHSLASAAAFNNTAAVTTTTTTTTTTATVMGTITTSADLAVTNSGPTTVGAGTTVTYTLKVTNNGPSDAQMVTLTDTLPTGGTLVSLTPNTGNADMFTVTGATATANTVGAGNTDTFVLVATAAATLTNGADFSNTASVMSATTPDPNTNNNTAKVTGTISNTANLSITKTGPTTANEGDLLTYTVTLMNTGPLDAQGVVLTDVLPAGLSFVVASTSQGTFTQTGGTVTFTIGTVTNGQTITASVVAMAGEEGSFIDTASVTSTTPDSNASNSSSVTTQVAESPITLSGAEASGMEFNALNAVTLATFTHAVNLEPASAFSASIAWGDGTSSTGTVVSTAFGYSVQGSHTYKDEGNFTATVTVSQEGTTASVKASVSIGEAPLPAGVLNQPVTSTINETLDDLFLQQPSATQVSTLASLLTGLESAGSLLLVRSGLDAATASSLSTSFAEAEFSLVSKFLAGRGTNLNTTVVDLELLFLVQTAALEGTP